MAGRGPAPATTRQRANKPARGDWKATPGNGWQHGPIPDPPDDLGDASVTAWQTWFRSWFAAHWTPENLPQIELTIRLHNQVMRAVADPFIEVDTDKGTSYIRRPSPATELRQHMDSLGITPKGQQDRRWEKPVDRPTPPAPVDDRPEEGFDPRTAFGHLHTTAHA